MANLTLVANPEEPRQPRQNSVVTIADILASIAEAQATNPEWFKPGQGWEPKPDKEEKAK